MATQLHKKHYRAIWASQPFFRACGLLANFILWPVYILQLILEATRRNGRMIAERTGKSQMMQAWEQLCLAARYGFRPRYYYIMELFLPDNRRRAGDYVHRFALKDSLYRMTKADMISPLTDKVGFTNFCLERNLPVAGTVVSLMDGAVVEKEFAGLPAKDLFVKRTRGRGGARAELWRYDQGRYANRDGLHLDAAALLARVIELSRQEPYVVQERLINHPDIADLSPRALATVRLLTMVNETGEIEGVRALFRMGASAESIVDNFHAGGIAAPVDLATGMLGIATDFGLAPSVGWLDRHPATGAVITGRHLPEWDQVLDLAKRAHDHFADRAIVGWDIAITTEGLVIVEGNAAPDVDNIQRPHRSPLGPTRFTELMLWHIERFEKAAMK